MYAIDGSTNAQSIVTFDLDTFTVTTVADVPTSAYGGPALRRLDGVAVGDGKVYLTSGSDDVRIAVYDIASGTFGPSLVNPPRSGENTSYPGGSTFLARQSNAPPPVCGDDICNGAENACSCARDCGVAPAETCDNGIDDDCDGSADCEDLDCAAEPICIAPPPSASLACDDLARFDSARCFADTLLFVVSTTVRGRCRDRRQRQPRSSFAGTGDKHRAAARELGPRDRGPYRPGRLLSGSDDNLSVTVCR